jgi:hypothetical protein
MLASLGQKGIRPQRIWLKVRSPSISRMDRDVHAGCDVVAI